MILGDKQMSCSVESVGGKRFQTNMSAAVLHERGRRQDGLFKSAIRGRGVQQIVQGLY